MLRSSLTIERQRYSWVASIFYFGYLAWVVPANLLIQRLPVAKQTGCMILVWSILLICHIWAKNYAGILVLRFVLGMFEASISPSLMVIVSMFYTREEQPLRLTLFQSFNGFATMVGALLGYGLGHATHTALKSWQLIFLTIGLLNFVWAWVFLWLMPDSPANAKFLSHRERIIAVHRIAKNMTGMKTTRYKFKQVLEAFLDIQVIALAMIGLGTGVINGGVSNFSTALITGYGFSGLNATLLQLPTGAIEWIVIPILGWICTRKDLRLITIMVSCLVPFAGLLGIRLTPIDRRWTLVGCTWLQYLVGCPVILSWTVLTANIAGHTKRSTANAAWFLLYAAGNIVGANIFQSKNAPRYFSALYGLLACYAGIILIAFFLRLYLSHENHRREKAFGSSRSDGQEQEAIAYGFLDVTDKESAYFRYAL